jgi:hypothetical protein
LGRKKIINKPKITNVIKKESEPKEKEILNRNLILIEISELKEMPFCWTRGYTLQENDTIEGCCKQYEKCFNHEPLEGWLYTNKQGHKSLRLKVSDEEKLKQ